MAIIYSCRLNKKYKRKLNIGIFTSGILGGLVGITAICTLCRPWEALIIGAVGSTMTCIGNKLLGGGKRRFYSKVDLVYIL